jgi:hypothetical protein
MRFTIAVLMLVVVAWSDSGEPIYYSIGTFCVLGVQAVAAVKAYRTGIPDYDWGIMR